MIFIISDFCRHPISGVPEDCFRDSWSTAMFTYFSTALADSRTVSRSRGRNVGMHTYVGSIEDEDVSLSTYGYTYIRVSRHWWIVEPFVSVCSINTDRLKFILYNPPLSLSSSSPMLFRISYIFWVIWWVIVLAGKNCVVKWGNFARAKEDFSWVAKINSCENQIT